jgi:iron(III) transport system ATP-binding protein
VVTGKVLDDSRISVAGVVLRGSGGSFVPGGAGAPLGSMSIRQHDIALGMGEPREGEENVLPAVVTRNVFLGGNRDYVVEAAEGTQLRVLAPASQNIPRGSRVHARLPVDNCRILVA